MKSERCHIRQPQLAVRSSNQPVNKHAALLLLVLVRYSNQVRRYIAYRSSGCCCGARFFCTFCTIYNYFYVTFIFHGTILRHIWSISCFLKYHILLLNIVYICLNICAAWSSSYIRMYSLCSGIVYCGRYVVRVVLCIDCGMCMWYVVLELVRN